MLDICRICLYTNIELQTLEVPLSKFYNNLLEYGLDEYALYCLKCVYLLKKFYNFRNKCKKAHIVLKKWMKQSKLTKINELHMKIPTSINLSNHNNHAINSYNAKTVKEYTENNIESLVTNNIQNIDISDEDLSNFKPGFVILDSTCPPYHKYAFITKTTDLEEHENSIDKIYITTSSHKSRLKTGAEKENRVTRSSKANMKSNSGIDRSNQEIKVEKGVKEKQIIKHTTPAIPEALVKIENDGKNNKYNCIPDDSEAIEEELKIEANNDDGIVLNGDDINDNSQEIVNDATNNEVIKSCGTNNSHFNVEKILKEALQSDSSDDDVVIEKRRKVISSRKNTETKKKKETLKKRKSKNLQLDVIELNEDEPKQKKLRWKPLGKEDLEDTKRDVKRKLGNDVKDKAGNDIDVDVILNHLNKMQKYTYNKIKRYCAGTEPLSYEAIKFLAKIVKRYGNQYSSIFITKHLTTDEEIMEEFRKRETNENYVQCEHKCTKCFRHFRGAKMVDHHIAEYHDPSKPYKCQYCGVSFNRSPPLRKHLLAHRVVYQCKLCPFLTNYTSVMETHFNNHKGVRYPCTKCDADFRSPPSLAAHMNCMHQADHICPCCARNFHSEYGLHTHKLKKHTNEFNTVGPPSAKCEQCNIQFISDVVYESHQRKSHSDPKNIIAGIDISKKSKPSSIKRSPRFPCRVCKHIESSMGALIWHFKSEHPNEVFDRKNMILRDPHPFLCHQCGKGFKIITALTDHKNVHTGARPYTCTECPKAFHCRTYLRNHIAVHSPPKEQCSQCGKKFHSKSNLSNHMKQHTGDRRYACKICGKMFLHQCAVNAHVRGVHLHIRRTRKPAKQNDMFDE